MTGKGTFTWGEDGHFYFGDWVKGNRHGKGKMTWFGVTEEENCWYKGEWEDDKISGKGKMTWGDGQKYKGTWTNNVRDKEGK